VVPVTKGNGYGVGNRRLAAEAERLRLAGAGAARVLAVGTPAEALDVAADFGGDLLVMQPYHPALAEPEPACGLADRVLRVAASVEVARKVAGDGCRLVVELMTSMRRHGVEPAELRECLRVLDRSEIAGFTLHLPLPAARRRGGDSAAEVDGWLAELRDAGALPAPVYVSHLGAESLDRLRERHPDADLRPRVGTQLWLGDPAALTMTATVQDLHAVRRGDPIGYRRRRAPWAGTLVVLAGGTAHGLGLEAPRFVRGVRDRLALGAHFGLAELNRPRSPFTVAGRQPLLVEPPHMQATLVLLPARVPAPAIGDEVAVRVRRTTTTADRVVYR
jgi:alanine racemase-like protein